MRFKLHILSTIILIVGLLSTSAFAKGFKGNKCMHKMDGMMCPRLPVHLLDDLTADQKKQIANIEKERDKKIIDIVSKIKTNEIDLRDLLMADTIDIAKVTDVAKKIGELRASIVVEEAKALADIKKILTEKQQAKLKELMYERRPMKHNRKFK